MSLRPGDLDLSDVEKFFLSNPTWKTPVINVAGEFFFAIPHVVFSHIHAIVSDLVVEAGVRRKLEKRRSSYLESKIRETFECVFPNAELASNTKWTLNNKRFETDLLVQIDRVVLIVEAKSAALTPQGLRSA